MDQAGFCGMAPARDEELRARGWSRQFTASEPRLSEAVEEYQSLGFQVHLEPFDASAKPGQGGCTSCYEDPLVAAQFKTIYTRPVSLGQGEDLF